MRCRDRKLKEKKVESLKGKIINLQEKIADYMIRDGFANDVERAMFYGMTEKVAQYQKIQKEV